MATLKSLVDETTNIKNELAICHNNLKDVLTEKGVEVAEEDKMSSLIDKIRELNDKQIIVPGEDFDFYYDKNEYRTSTSSSTITKWTQVSKYIHDPKLNVFFDSNVLISFLGNMSSSSWPGEFKVEIIRNEEIVFQKVLAPSKTGYIKYSLECNIKNGDDIRFYLRQVNTGGISYIKDCKISYSLKALGGV